MISEKPLSSFALGCDGELFKTGGDVTALLDEGAHADDFHGAIPCSRKMTSEEIRGAYEEETGRLILETFRRRNIPMLEVPACLIHSTVPSPRAFRPRRRSITPPSWKRSPGSSALLLRI